MFKFIHAMFQKVNQAVKAVLSGDWLDNTIASYVRGWDALETISKSDASTKGNLQQDTAVFVTAGTMLSAVVPGYLFNSVPIAIIGGVTGGLLIVGLTAYCFHLGYAAAVEEIPLEEAHGTMTTLITISLLFSRSSALYNGVLGPYLAGAYVGAEDMHCQKAA